MSALTPAQVLRAAADLIEPKGTWCQGPAATNASGESVDADDDRACCFCAYGAIMRVADEDMPMQERAYEACSQALYAEGYAGLVDFNEDPGTTQAEVVAKLREVADSLDATSPANPQTVGEGGEG